MSLNLRWLSQPTHPLYILVAVSFVGLGACDSSSDTDDDTDDDTDTDTDTDTDSDSDACEAGPEVALETFTEASKDALRVFFDTDHDFSDGVVTYHDTVTPVADWECATDDSVLAYTVELPTAFRERDRFGTTDNQVQVVWALYGSGFGVPAIVVGQSDDPNILHPFTRSQFLHVPVFNLMEDVSQTRVDTVVANLTSAFPWLGEPGSLEFFPPDGPTEALVIVPGNALNALNIPEQIGDTREIYEAMFESQIVKGVNLGSFGIIGEETNVTDGVVVTAATIELDCLRTESTKYKLSYETSLSPPLGEGRTLTEDCWEL